MALEQFSLKPATYERTIVVTRLDDFGLGFALEASELFGVETWAPEHVDQELDEGIEITHDHRAVERNRAVRDVRAERASERIDECVDLLRTLAAAGAAHEPCGNPRKAFFPLWILERAGARCDRQMNNR